MKIIQEFQNTLALKVDCPKYGYGNTYNGSASRKFFEHHDISSRLGVSQSIIKRFGVILNVLNSREMVNGPKFEEYGARTANLLGQMYPERKLTPTIH